MGGPQHFGIDLPQRCLMLLDSLWESASETYSEPTRHLGPLTSTFLISMSMPIINIPIERIERQLGLRDAEGYVDDRHINAEITKAFEDVLKRGHLRQAPFFDPDSWRFFHYRGDTINLSRNLLEEVAAELDKDEAAENAANMNASEWLSILRNALAHGGILYLNEHGRSSRDAPVRMFGFVCGKFNDGPCRYDNTQNCRAVKVLDGLKFLRICEPDYRNFLHRWVNWMREAGIAAEAD